LKAVWYFQVHHSYFPEVLLEWLAQFVISLVIIMIEKQETLGGERRNTAKEVIR
jgi:hypothetical protein